MKNNVIELKVKVYLKKKRNITQKFMVSTGEAFFVN